MRKVGGLFALVGALGCNSLTGFGSLEKVDCVDCGFGGNAGSGGGTAGTGGGAAGGGYVPSQLSSLVAGRHSTCTTTQVDGVTRCWGSKPGDGTGEATRPVIVPGITDAAIVQGFDHRCGFNETTVWCWGGNDRGQLGDGTTVTRLTPVEVNLPPIERMSAAASHTCASTPEDPPRIFCWGDNAFGQLGTGDTINRLTPFELLGLPAVLRFGAGVDYTCALTVGAELYCWGNNECGQLGIDPATSPVVPTPTLVTGIPALERIYPGYRHTCGRTDGERRLVCWGANDHGQLGDGTTTSRFTALQINEINELNVAYPGMQHTCAIESETAELFCWGSNAHGQVAAPLSSTELLLPMNVASNVQGLAGKASEHTCYMNLDFDVLCAGLNDSGQLGVGTYESNHVPSPVLY